MTSISKRISKISAYLQSLSTPQFSEKIEKAVQKQDRQSIIAICREAKIPKQYSSTIVSVLFSKNVSPMDKYPDFL